MASAFPHPKQQRVETPLRGMERGCLGLKAKATASKTALVSWARHNEAAQTSLSNRSVCCHSSRCWKSKVRESP